MADLLFELGTEELPSGAVQPLGIALLEQMTAELAKANLRHGTARYFATPRRLAILFENVDESQAPQTIERRGPTLAMGMQQEQPTAALLGFAKSCGVSIAELTTVQTDKGSWWVYQATHPGAKTRDLLPGMLQRAIAALPVAKLMRWGSLAVEFARPVQWAVLLLGHEVVPAEILGVNTGRHTYGHRFLAPKALEITTPTQYETLLQEAFVLANFTKRQQIIVQQVEHLAASQQGQAIIPPALLDEVTSIVEWPQALLVNFDQSFLAVPAEALIAAMQTHQKCFALQTPKGALMPHFITVANIQSLNTAQVIQGNERVMRARLSDAAFFFQQDQKQSLMQRIAATEHVVFQAQLGSLADKALRIQALMTYFVHPLQLNESEATRAAQLSKCDLLTGMVGEFPELQGLMGSYYARHDGESAAVASALYEQYLPRFAADEIPHSPLGLALSLADRLDTLVGIFAIGQKPTGVKDPFKLRRHALAVIRMLITMPGPLNLTTLLQQAWQNYADRFSTNDPIYAEQLTMLKAFILERLFAFYQTQGIGIDRVQAVRACQDDNIYDLNQRIIALQHFSQLPEADALSAACKRVNNLLHQVENTSDPIVDPQLLMHIAEKNLYMAIQETEQQAKDQYLTGSYVSILTQLAHLRQPVDAFFNEVMVMVDDRPIRHNRIALLTQMQKVLQGVADISLLQI